MATEINCGVVTPEAPDGVERALPALESVADAQYSTLASPSTPLSLTSSTCTSIAPLSPSDDDNCNPLTPSDDDVASYTMYTRVCYAREHHLSPSSAVVNSVPAQCGARTGVRHLSQSYHCVLAPFYAAGFLAAVLLLIATTHTGNASHLPAPTLSFSSIHHVSICNYSTHDASPSGSRIRRESPRATSLCWQPT